MTGWAIGQTASAGAPRRPAPTPTISIASSRTVVLPLYYDDRARWIWMMKQAISKIAGYFNSPAHDAPLRGRGLSAVERYSISFKRILPSRHSDGRRG